MKMIKNITWMGCLVLIFASCRKNETLDVKQFVGLGGDSTSTTAIDKWIADSLTTPYNIAVKYRWDPANASLYKTLTPADESRVIPLFSAVKQVWINPYNDETGSSLFIKKYAPKQFVLIGSVEYDYGSVTLGQAEGGNNIVLYDVNQNFDKNAETSIRRVIHTAHHEFAHILHQTVKYPLDFVGTSSKLGLANYTATWYNIADADALQQGYVTAYAMAAPDEDFVETIAIMLTEGKARFEEMKASANPTARQALQQKENFVVTYYRQVWNIDFYRLQTRVQAALLTLFPVPAVSAAYGYNTTYSTASVDPASTFLLPQPAAFTAIFNAAKTGLAAMTSDGTSGRVLDSLAVLYNSSSSVVLACFFHTPAAPNSVQFAAYLYTFSNPGGVYTFTLNNMDVNGTTFAAALAPLVNYFSGNKFTISWYADPSVSIYPRVKFTPQAIPGTYFIALLKP